MNRNNDNNGKYREFTVIFPPQHQNRHPGFEYVVNPRPMNCNCRKLENKVALITEGYSGIDRAVAYDFVKEGASVAIVYYDEDRDVEHFGKLDVLVNNHAVQMKYMSSI